MHLKNLLAVLALVALSACSSPAPGLTPSPGATVLTPLQTEAVTVPTASPQPSATPTPLPPPPSLLTICLGREPASLFLYDALSLSARSVLQAVYDGPFDLRGYTPQPVILQRMPSLENGAVTIQPVTVQPGAAIVDAEGLPAALAEGVFYRPSGCTETACARQYSGSQPVEMDQLVVRFELLPGLKWSDGAALTADDSLFSYELARSLYPAAQPERVERTQSYQAVDETTVEWAGLPGDLGGAIQDKFFSPLPRHAWSLYPAQDLPSQELAARTPLGWGPYVIDEWVAGDHITLHRNPFYFQADQGLPHFDNLVFRFTFSDAEALEALQVGECDLVDSTALPDPQIARLGEMLQAGQAQVVYQSGIAWDLLAFGIRPYDVERPGFFENPAVRQAVARCVDRQAILEALGDGPWQLADSYLPPSHPLYQPAAAQYSFDPQAGMALLEAAGWLDQDGDPATPRTSLSVPGFADGASFTLTYLVSQDSERLAVAQVIQASLAQCGIQVTVDARPAQEYLAAGPVGPVFGRSFDLAQLAWAAALEPPCRLYLSDEIPGPYPDYAHGWGGMNASGYSSPAFDLACQSALLSPSGSAQYLQAHADAQALFAADLPALPLYWRFRALALRPDACGLTADGLLADLELLDYGDGCR